MLGIFVCIFVYLFEVRFFFFWGGGGGGHLAFRDTIRVLNNLDPDRDISGPTFSKLSKILNSNPGLATFTHYLQTRLCNLKDYQLVKLYFV